MILEKKIPLMAYLPQIQKQLRERFSELCEACFAEQEWLEEGCFFDATERTPLPAGNGSIQERTEEKSADAA